ncbi:MAG: type II secretion system protein GspD [Candidatus Dadabacteria bacterium]|nr:type II secretion system protein GspD [Candidatus Dadabacteria bacterium]MYA48613.1 type II secretion system protein GspD [Candidatus Dadabacteria bacterium]MYG82781.1 type II secretion system protein GspD [Candidatus Dadabacteria bacterium]MYK48759.1 type II secretion system protein GspD [Candidatus Dadabacteria bacterium]
MKYLLNSSLFPILSAVLFFSVSVVCPQPAFAEKSEPLPDLTRAKVVVAPGTRLKKTPAQNESGEDSPSEPAEVTEEAAKLLAEEAAKDPRKETLRPFGKDAVKVSGNETVEGVVEEPGLPLDLAPEGVVAESESEPPKTPESQAQKPEETLPAVAEAPSEEVAGATGEEIAEVPVDETLEEQGEEIPEDQGMVNLRANMTLKEMVKTISEITSEVYLLSDKIRDKNVTIITPQGGFEKENAFRIFEILLDMNGYSVVSADGVNKVVPKKGIKSESIPLRQDFDPGESSQKYVMKLIKLKSVKAKGVSNTLRSLVSKEGFMKPYEPSNTLVVIDNEQNVNRIAEVVASLDYNKKIEFVRVHNTSSASVIYKLLEIFSPQSAKRKASKSQKDGFVSGSSELLGFKVINDERTNSIIVIADPRDISLIKETIAVLDIESEHAEQDVYVIPVKNADAEQIIEVLGNLFAEGEGGAMVSSVSSRGQTRESGRTGQSSNRLGEGNLSRGGNTGGLGSQGGTIERVGSSKTGGGSVVVSSADGLKITSDPATNSIIVIGSLTQYRMVKQIVDKLDIRRRQVFVEAAILEVGLDNLNALGTNFGLGLRIEGDNLGFIGQQLPGIPSLLGVAADPAIATTSIGSLSGLFLGVVGEEVDADGSGPLPALPSFSAVFQALSSVTDVNVLSTPSIITTDNEPAEIVVADVIPFPMGSTVGTSGVTVQTIERLPVGIRLSITPQISEGEYLNLDIVTEVSSTREAPAGLNTAQFGIATTTRSADSSVIVKNGQTLVIGGLVQDREEVLHNKTPLLGDIPLIGNLFRFKRNQSRKLNLMILLTPRIVETESDMKQLLLDHQRRKTLLHRRDLNTLE